MRLAVAGLLIVGCALSGCNGQESAMGTTGPKSQGRYAGIGTFDAGRLWAEITATDPADPAAAKIADDEHVIVVVDSHTGEVRQCGDHSGYCVSMNPWSGGAPAAAPVKLKKHAADLEAEDEEVRIEEAAPSATAGLESSVKAAATAR